MVNVLSCVVYLMLNVVNVNHSLRHDYYIDYDSLLFTIMFTLIHYSHYVLGMSFV